MDTGGDPNIGDYSSRTPLHNAAQYGNLEVLSSSSSSSSFVIICPIDQKVTKALVAGGGQAGGKDKYGDSATSLARLSPICHITSLQLAFQAAKNCGKCQSNRPNYPNLLKVTRILCISRSLGDLRAPISIIIKPDWITGLWLTKFSAGTLATQLYTSCCRRQSANSRSKPLNLKSPTPVCFKQHEIDTLAESSKKQMG